MELKVKTPTFPEVIEFNFNELKQEITERASAYVNLVYTEEQIQDAKKDRANLNKFVKALSDERIKIKKECLKPYEDFEMKIKELDKIVSAAISNIDSQVKEYEEKKKQDKKDKIYEFYGEKFAEILPDIEMIHIDKMWDAKWLNASTSMKSIQDEITARLEQIKNDIATLSNLPEFGFEATEVYKSTLDINTALNEGHRLSEIQKRKAEHEAEQARLAAEAEAKKQEEQLPGQMEFHDAKSFEECMNPPVEKAPARQWVSFKAFLTVADAVALKRFFDAQDILFERI